MQSKIMWRLHDEDEWKLFTKPSGYAWSFEEFWLAFDFAMASSDMRLSRQFKITEGQP